jgi:hypothetical protein
VVPPSVTNTPTWTPTGVQTPPSSPTSGPSLTPTLTPTAVPTCDLPFTDVDQYNPFYVYIRCLYCRGIISGYADNTFRPYNTITRGQVAKLIANAAGFFETIPSDQQTFADVPVSNPFWPFVERLAGRGVISGYSCGGPGEPCDGANRPYFRPTNLISRGQLAKIDSNAAGYNDIPDPVPAFTDVPLSQPFWVYIARLAHRGIISGYECGGPGEPCDGQNLPYFRPTANISRGQTSKIAANTFFPINCAPGPTQ